MELTNDNKKAGELLNSNTERITYLDYARVFVVYLVILGHLYPIESQSLVRVVIYSFHMPFFFMVSGMLHKFNGTIQWKKYFKTIGIPILFFNVLFVFTNAFYTYIGLFKGGEGMTYLQIVCNNIYHGVGAVLYNGNPPSGPTWFLFALLLCKIVLDCICIARKPLIGLFFLLILYFIGFGLYIPHFYFRNMLMIFPFYYLGYKYKKEINDFLEKMKPQYIWSLFFLILTCVLAIMNVRVSTKGVGFGALRFPLNVFVFYTNALIGSIMMLLISKMFKRRDYITYCATSLITILGIQNLFNKPYAILMPEGHLELMVPLAILVFIMCVEIHKLLMRYVPWVLGKF